jgi:hypothetical protein
MSEEEVKATEPSTPDDCDEKGESSFDIGTLGTPKKADGTKKERKDLQRVRAIKKHRPERDSLSLEEGDILFVRSKDGMGWCEAERENGEVGWIPLEKVEEIHDNPIGEVGTKPEMVRFASVRRYQSERLLTDTKSALDHFLKEAQKKPSKGAVSRVRAMTADGGEASKVRCLASSSFSLAPWPFCSPVSCESETPCGSCLSNGHCERSLWTRIFLRVRARTAGEAVAVHARSSDLTRT